MSTLKMKSADNEAAAPGSPLIALDGARHKRTRIAEPSYRTRQFLLLSGGLSPARWPTARFCLVERYIYAK